MYKFISLACLFLACNINANEASVLTVDRVIPKAVEFSFPNDKRLTPKRSDFILDNYVIMSNELGERWAVLTLTNESSGQRILDQDHILALFANGQRANPLEFKLNFEGKETQSITVSFGGSKFPILSVSTQLNK